VNILDFVAAYYVQFKEKLEATIARLDAEAREKVKTLIDVSKWTVQKFAQVKSNIDKRHRQLNKACKQEEEALMQNVAALVLTASRKKYVKRDDGLEGLARDGDTLQDKEDTVVVFQRNASAEHLVVRQMELLEKRHLEPKWPDSQAVEASVAVIFERLRIVREVNKRHI